MKNLFIKHLIVSLIAPHLDRSLIFFCFAIGDFYKEGSICVDGSLCLILLDLRIDLSVSLRCEYSPTLYLLPTNFLCCY